MKTGWQIYRCIWQENGFFLLNKGIRQQLTSREPNIKFLRQQIFYSCTSIGCYPPHAVAFFNSQGRCLGVRGYSIPRQRSSFLRQQVFILASASLHYRRSLFFITAAKRQFFMPAGPSFVNHL